MSASTDRFEQDGLIITVAKSARSVSITWSGVSDSRNPATFLNPFIRKLVQEVRGFAVTIDFTALEYMNSATVSPIIHFIKALDADGTQVLVLFTENDWQRVHLRCLRSIARTLTHVRVEGKLASSNGA
jgi:hypothetical protein